MLIHKGRHKRACGMWQTKTQETQATARNSSLPHFTRKFNATNRKVARLAKDPDYANLDLGTKNP